MCSLCILNHQMVLVNLKIIEIGAAANSFVTNTSERLKWSYICTETFVGYQVPLRLIRKFILNVISFVCFFSLRNIPLRHDILIRSSQTLIASSHFYKKVSPSISRQTHLSATLVLSIDDKTFKQSVFPIFMKIGGEMPASYFTKIFVRLVRCQASSSSGYLVLLAHQVPN